MEQYYVYWYRLKEFNNPHYQGYIGITNNMERRNKEHWRGVKPTHFYNALRKYGPELVTYEILHVTEHSQEALDYEFYYRPENNIGWNSATGGEDTLGSFNRREVSLYHKDDPETLHTFESIIEASEKLGVTAARITQALYRKSQHYGFDGWAVVTDENIDRRSTVTIQEAISKRLSGIKKNKPSHFKGITDRWSKEERERIGNQHRGKKLSEKVKRDLKERNRKNSKCVPITLSHKDDPAKEFTYHSMSEASRQLGLPLPRIKSKAQRSLNVYGKDGWKIVKLGAE